MDHATHMGELSYLRKWIYVIYFTIAYVKLEYAHQDNVIKWLIQT